MKTQPKPRAVINIDADLHRKLKLYLDIKGIKIHFWVSKVVNEAIDKGV